MESPLGKVMTAVALVLCVPAACLGAMAFYGKALADSEVAEGTLLTPEQRAEREARELARFRAMGPAEHLAAAREALACGYESATGTGGDIGGAERHVGAIPASAPERGGAAAVLAEIARRRATVLQGAMARLEQYVREHRDESRGDDCQQGARRAGLANRLDGLSALGLGCVHAVDAGGTTLRFSNPRCDPEMLGAIVRPGSHSGLRALGFRSVRCANGRGSIDL